MYIYIYIYHAHKSETAATITVRIQRKSLQVWHRNPIDNSLRVPIDTSRPKSMTYSPIDQSHQSETTAKVTM